MSLLDANRRSSAYKYRAIPYKKSAVEFSRRIEPKYSPFVAYRKYDELSAGFMNANDERAQAEEQRRVLTIQTSIPSAQKPQHRLVAVNGGNCIAVGNPISLIIRY
jgi:hypothetical protein